ncbi:MAG TPA: condensation domain-containing protein [Thermoanaerobaculia bacterium]|nr:condensation domain-containing protein [Thermoanaerobaculia bacterium]
MAAAQDLAQRRSRLTPAQRALLEKRLSGGRGGQAEATAAGEDESWRISPRPGGGPAPLSFGESRLWHFARRWPESDAYNVYHAVGLSGPLDVPALAASLRAVVERHEVLWSRFTAEDGVLLARTDRGLLPPGLPVIDLGGLPEAGREPEGSRVAVELATPGFAPERGPLLRLALLRTAAAEHALLLAAYHLVLDGWSLAVLVREVAAVYGEVAAGRPSPLPPAAALQASDFAVWQRRRIDDGALAADLAWWRQHLAGASPAGLAWPARPQAPSGRSTRLLGAELSEALKALAQRERATLFVTLLAGFQAVLHRYQAGTGVILGVPMALRGRPETAGIVGCLLNLLALRPDLGGDPTFAELLHRVRDTFLGAFTHREAPIEWLARELVPGHDPALIPWITVTFNMPLGGTGHAEPLRAHGVELVPLLTGEVGSEYDLALYAREVPGGIRLDLGHNANVLAPGEVAQLLAGFAALLEEAVAHPERRLSELAGWMGS